MGGANENPTPIDFKHPLQWYILGIWRTLGI
jgi:hypothetical protein